ncbi:GTPase HflX [Anaerolentibacter hominis]|uniref:GTPase HflX n=1 Tax=Anaerolentibacter hominis TaxID=3079009 RepID=UPI0031B899B9
MDYFDNEELKEQVILVGVSLGEQGIEDTSAEESLDELEELVQTAGAVTVGRLLQNRERVHPGTYIGKGKIDEVRELLLERNATGVICDDELTPAQMRNLEDALDVKVMDRTMVILDIFAQRATTKEGKIQVELAQLRYRATRLVGMRNSLSRLGGGIGTRGPGEKKLEMDRRLIRERISRLKQELEDVKSSRETARKQRSANPTPVIALVGYTNTGKSTLLNKLTGAGVLEEDKLFATLDPTTRSLKLASGQEILLTDTVGFIRKLPHHLVEAFRSTLEEAKYADIILHVVDSANPMAYIQMHTVYETLKLLNIQDKTIITVFNKQDLLESPQIIRDLKADKTVKISARTGEGLDQLLAVIEETLQEQKILIEHVFSYQEAGKLAPIRKFGQILEEEYREDGIFVKAYVPSEIWKKNN